MDQGLANTFPQIIVKEAAAYEGGIQSGTPQVLVLRPILVFLYDMELKINLVLV